MAREHLVKHDSKLAHELFPGHCLITVCIEIIYEAINFHVYLISTLPLYFILTTQGNNVFFRDESLASWVHAVELLTGRV